MPSPGAGGPRRGLSPPPPTRQNPARGRLNSGPPPWAPGRTAPSRPPPPTRGRAGTAGAPRDRPPPPLPPPPPPVARRQRQAASPCTDRPPRFGPLRSARRRPGAPRGPPFHHHGGHGRVRGTSRSAWRQRGGSSVVRLPLTHRQANSLGAGRLARLRVSRGPRACPTPAGVVGGAAVQPPPPPPP